MLKIDRGIDGEGRTFALTCCCVDMPELVHSPISN